MFVSLVSVDRYEYDGEEYVWSSAEPAFNNFGTGLQALQRQPRPFVQEVRHEYVSVPHDHLDVMPAPFSLRPFACSVHFC